MHSALVSHLAHPQLACVADIHQLRVYPEDITINIAAEAPIPVPNIPGNWKEIIHDNTDAWLAT